MEEQEKTATKTEEQDGKLNITGLIARIGEGVLINPYLVAVIEAAPSPKAADEYIRRLGWPNDLARKVRQGVHLRDKCRVHGAKLWEELSAVSTRLSDQMFEFRFRPDCLNFENCVVSWENAFQLDGIKVPNDKRPLFLREVRCQMKSNDYNGTSVDGGGLKEYGDNNFATIDGLPRVHYPYNKLDFGYLRLSEWTGTFKNKSTLKVMFPQDHGFAFFKVGERHSEIGIRTKNVLLEANPAKDRIFPRFYKVLEMENTVRTGEEWYEETVRMFLRRDYGPLIETNICFRDDWVTFERVAHISSKVDVALEVHYQVFPMGNHLSGYLKDVSPVQVRLRMDDDSGRPMDMSSFPKKEIAEATGEFSELAGRMLNYAGSESSFGSITLERLAGISLATNPPKELAELFLPAPVAQS